MFFSLIELQIEVGLIAEIRSCDQIKSTPAPRYPQELPAVLSDRLDLQLRSGAKNFRALVFPLTAYLRSRVRLKHRASTATVTKSMVKAAADIAAQTVAGSCGPGSMGFSYRELDQLSRLFRRLNPDRFRVAFHPKQRPLKGSAP